MTVREEINFVENKLINGKNMANVVNQLTQNKVNDCQKRFNTTPTFVVIVVGDNPSSARYVNNKKVTSEKFGMVCIVDKYPETITQEELREVIVKWNLNITIFGIIVQLPLPKHIDARYIANIIDPEKDIDGLNSLNIGKLHAGEDVVGRTPCTAEGIMVMLKMANVSVSGKNVLVIGRSEIVGKPVSRLLERENATVTLAHSKTPKYYLNMLIGSSDIIISAVGNIGMIRKEHITDHGQVIIDVGTTVDIDGKLKGDVKICSKVLSKVNMISPVPGGVGPMTIAMLMNNVVENTIRIMDKRSKR